MPIYGLMALLLCLQGNPAPGQPVQAPPGVKVANERLVLVTEAGSIVIALYPEVAPQNVRQIMTLANAGVYNGTCFPRLEKNFVLQLSSPESDRRPPLTPDLKSLIHALPAEFSNLKHVRGVVSMAREDKDINSAKSSFSILLGPAPHLDKLGYTIVGHVEYGMDVVSELAQAPVKGSMPKKRLKVLQAGLVTAEQLRQHPPTSAKVIFQPGEEDELDEETAQLARRIEFEQNALPMKLLATGGILLMIVCCLINVFLPHLTGKQIRTVNLIAVLIGAFVLVSLLRPLSLTMFHTGDMTNIGHLIAIAIFFGMLGVFRLMSSFESAS
ncbi:MAG TPA: peptidylprolyl isomerase [Gemmatales bacterium]|nr:peptidylprolyl isomerase [Gemmatales bacterium]